MVVKQASGSFSSLSIFPFFFCPHASSGTAVLGWERGNKYKEKPALV